MGDFFHLVLTSLLLWRGGSYPHRDERVGLETMTNNTTTTVELSNAVPNVDAGIDAVRTCPDEVVDLETTVHGALRPHKARFKLQPVS